MDLNFICPHHEHQILRDGVCADELWQKLSAQGKAEAQMGYWAKAASYFGSATEVAILRASVEQHQAQLDYLNMAIYTAHWLIDAFCQLGDLKSAKRYLVFTERNITNLLQREPYIKNGFLNDKKLKTSINKFNQTSRAKIRQLEISNFYKNNIHLKLVPSTLPPKAAVVH